MTVFVDIFVLNDNTLSSHMAQTSQPSNLTNHKIHYCDQMIKMIVNLGSKKGDKNDDSSLKLTNLHNSVLIKIVDTNECIYLVVKESQLQSKCTHLR